MVYNYCDCYQKMTSTAPFNEATFVTLVGDEYLRRCVVVNGFTDIYDIIDEFLVRYPDFREYPPYLNSTLSQIQYHLFSEVDEYINDGCISEADTYDGEDN